MSNSKIIRGLSTGIVFLIMTIGSGWSGDCLPTSHENCRTNYTMKNFDMSPTILIGDSFNADTHRYSAQLPDRGDVVVLISPTIYKGTYVKRIVGLPEDRIQMENGTLFINGDAVERTRVDDYMAKDSNGAGRGYPVEQFEETLPNGVTYRVLDLLLDGVADNTTEYLVPPEHYFMLGDNRDDSRDSRYLNAMGYVPRANIIGKALQINSSADPSRIGVRIK
jgi:signal peptidase I